MTTLLFPLDPTQPGSGEHSHAGADYYWDPVTNSWVLLSSQSVNKNYVDSRDSLRYRRDGHDFIYGDVHIKEGNSSTDFSNVKLKNDGTIITARESHLIFSSENGAAQGRISYGNPDNKQVPPVTLFYLNTSYIRPTAEFRLSSEDVLNQSGKVCFATLENHGHPEMLLFDCENLGSDSGQIDFVISLPEADDANFVVRGQGTDHVKVNSTGKLTVVHSDEESFVVTNALSVNDPPLRVDADTHKIFASEQYSEALRSRNQGGTVTGPDGDVFHSFKEENLLATKGYVDDRVGGSPGRTVCADREEDAEIGGFWWDGRGLFLRVG